MTPPRIGCIAWGSLLWDPRTLPLAGPFVHAGPMLPIEFSRVALDGRVTLVIDPEAAPIRTFWAPLAVESLEMPREALEDPADVGGREGAQRLGRTLFGVCRLQIGEKRPAFALRRLHLFEDRLALHDGGRRGRDL